MRSVRVVGGGDLLVSIYKPAESPYKLMIYKYGVFRLSFTSTRWLDREADGTFSALWVVHVYFINQPY